MADQTASNAKHSDILNGQTIYGMFCYISYFGLHRWTNFNLNTQKKGLNGCDLNQGDELDMSEEGKFRYELLELTFLVEVGHC